jgi:hypothetical protein
VIPITTLGARDRSSSTLRTVIRPDAEGEIGLGTTPVALHAVASRWDHVGCWQLSTIRRCEGLPPTDFSSPGVSARPHNAWLSERVATYRLGGKLHEISNKMQGRLEVCHITG